MSNTAQKPKEGDYVKIPTWTLNNAKYNDMEGRIIKTLDTQCIVNTTIGLIKVDNDKMIVVDKGGG